MASGSGWRCWCCRAPRGRRSAAARPDWRRPAHPPGTRLLRRGVRGDGAAQARLQRRPARGLRSHRPRPARSGGRQHAELKRAIEAFGFRSRAGLVRGPGRATPTPELDTPPPGACTPTSRAASRRSSACTTTAARRARALSPGARLRPRDQRDHLPRTGAGPGAYKRMPAARFLELWPLKYRRDSWTVIRFALEPGQHRRRAPTVHSGVDAGGARPARR